MLRTIPGLALLLVVFAVGATTRAAPPAEAKGKVARIVFVGKQNACDCTRKAIEASRKALQAALGNKSRFPIEELKVDVDGAKVDGYRSKRAFVALPAIYFLDGADGVKELLQGEVTEAQVRAVLK
jgi:hypothetical protein